MAESAEDRAFDAWEQDQMVGDRYRVQECLRQSGTCHLYRVADVYRGKLCLALRPSPRTIAKEGGRQWFVDFAKNALVVPYHPNVLTCTRMDREGEMPFLIMDNVEGEWWDSAIAAGSLTDLAQMLDVAIQVAHGLIWLHAHGIVHYNVKPANVLISHSGVAQVWKYGESDVKTRAYASPEQMKGNAQLSAATDVWSWAASVLHMFVGRVAWPSGERAPHALTRYMEEGPLKPGIPLMPGKLVGLLTRCLKAKPAERPESMEQVAAEMEQIYHDVTGEPYSPPSRVPESEVIGVVTTEEAAGLVQADQAEQAAEPVQATDETESGQRPVLREPDSGGPADQASKAQGGRRRFYQSRQRPRTKGRRRSP